MPAPDLVASQREACMKGIIAWALGVPFVIIILLYVVGVF